MLLKFSVKILVIGQIIDIIIYKQGREQPLQFIFHDMMSGINAEGIVFLIFSSILTRWLHLLIFWICISWAKMSLSQLMHGTISIHKHKKAEEKVIFIFKIY